MVELELYPKVPTSLTPSLIAASGTGLVLDLGHT